MKNKHVWAKWEAFLETLDPRKFDFRNWVTEFGKFDCGTVCCAVGWLPSISDKWVWNRHFSTVATSFGALGPSPEESVAKFFNISVNTVILLFYPAIDFENISYDLEGEYPHEPKWWYPLNHKATAQDVVERMRAYRKHYKIELPEVKNEQKQQKQVRQVSLDKEFFTCGDDGSYIKLRTANSDDLRDTLRPLIIEVTGRARSVSLAFDPEDAEGMIEWLQAFLEEWNEG